MNRLPGAYEGDLSKVYTTCDRICAGQEIRGALTSQGHYLGLIKGVVVVSQDLEPESRVL